MKSINYAIGMDHVFYFMRVFDTFHESCFASGVILIRKFLAGVLRTVTYLFLIDF